MSRGPPDRIKFKVKAVTSEDPDHPVTEVHLLAPHSRGWRSEKFCSYPQDMLLDLSRPTHVHQIQVLSHQYLIATKVDIHVLCPQAETAGEDGWTKLGHFVFESNQESDFAARELKTVKIDRMMTTQVKLSFWRGHVNKHNIYNQVGVVSVNLIGWPEDGMVPESEVPRLRGRRDESSFAGPTVLNNVGVAAARHHRGDGGRGGEENYAVMESTSKAGLNVGSAELVSLALEAGIDPFVMHIIREAHKHKHKAVVREDYEEARRLRDGIERLKMIGVRVAELEGKKQKAVENEDYESAHVLKLDIDKLRQSCVSLGIGSMQGAAVAQEQRNQEREKALSANYKPEITGQGRRSASPAKAKAEPLGSAQPAAQGSGNRPRKELFAAEGQDEAPEARKRDGGSPVEVAAEGAGEVASAAQA